MEYELKYAASGELPEGIPEDPAVKSAVSGPAEEIPMETTYYDTAAGELSRLRNTLRFRREGTRSVVTVKTPAGIEHARGEWETEAPDLAAGLPLLKALGAPELPGTAADYVPVCGARFRRTAIPLKLEGCTAELAIDRGILFREDRTLRFSELELELKSGDPAAMLELGRLLCERYALHEEPKSKFARAVSL